MNETINPVRPAISADGYFGQAHTAGLLRVGRPGAIVADHPVPEMNGSDAVEHYGGHLVGESITERNARRLVACWNACATVHTDALEDGFVEKTREDRNHLLLENADLREQLLTAQNRLALVRLEMDCMRDLVREFKPVAPPAILAQAAAVGADLDAESIEQGEPA